MILLDTNVISEPTKLAPDPAVLAWIEKQPPLGLYISAVTVMDVLDGVGRLPIGQKRALIAQTMSAAIHAFDNRILSFDFVTAVAYAQLTEKARGHGLPVSPSDAMIGATADVAGYSVATRDVGPFEAMGLKVINPWTA